MGRATVTGGGTDGLYTVDLDFGDAERDALVGSLTARKAEIEAAITQAESDLITLNSERSTALVALDAAIATYNASQQTDEDKNALGAASVASSEATAARNRKQSAKDVLEIELANVNQRIASLSAKALTTTRQVWCADYSQLGTGEVGTIEVNGDSDNVLIVPGAQPPASNDGELVSSHVMSSAQLYYDLAVLPGWEKYYPTYRAGVITALDVATDTCSVDLDAAVSSQQSLDINQSSSLSDVPIVYMTCHSEVFSVDDRVIVQFDNQDWDSPRVIGFESNPVPCAEKRLCFFLQVWDLTPPIIGAPGSNHHGYDNGSSSGQLNASINFTDSRYRTIQGSDADEDGVLQNMQNILSTPVPPTKYASRFRIRFDVAWYQDTGVQEYFVKSDNGAYDVQTHGAQYGLNPAGDADSHWLSEVSARIFTDNLTSEGAYEDWPSSGYFSSEPTMVSGTKYDEIASYDVTNSPTMGGPLPNDDADAVHAWLLDNWDSPPTTINVDIDGEWVEYTFERIGLRPDYFEDVNENVSVPVLSPDDRSSAYNVRPGLMWCVIYRQVDYSADE